MHTDKSALLNQLKKGNKEAFQHIYALYWDKLYLYAYNILEDKPACEDLVQELFVSLWIRRNELSVDNLNAYLFKALKFQVLNTLRNGKIRQRHLDQMDKLIASNTIEELLNFQELNDHLNSAMASLPDRCREIFYMSRYDHMTHQEIANQLNLSTQTVKNQISKAISYLKVSLESLPSILIFIILNR